ncbi:MAG TPA: hypothetical protein VFV46_08535 [Lacibacter sp.]|nr:hypothetical protein [Lacibacter sp.]
MLYWLILLVSNFAVVMTLGNSSLLPVCLLANYLLIRKKISFPKSTLRGFISFMPHLFVGVLLTVLQFSRDHDYYYNIVSAFHLQGMESNTPFTAVSLYHHVDLWCMALLMKIASLLRFHTEHVNYYSIINLFVVSYLSYRIWKVLFQQQILRYSLFLILLLIVNSYLSRFTWFIDFELNGTKQSLLLLIVFELLTTANGGLRKLYFLTFLAANPLICSWFTALLGGSYILSYGLRWNKKEFQQYFPYIRDVVLLSVVFWSFFIVRIFLFTTDFASVPGAVPYDLLLPESVKDIVSDVLFFYRYNLNEFYLRVMIIAVTILYLILLQDQLRLGITVFIYLIIDFIQAGYFGYKFFEFQQFTAIPLSIIALFVAGNMLYTILHKEKNYAVLSLFRRQSKASGLS